MMKFKNTMIVNTTLFTLKSFLELQKLFKTFSTLLLLLVVITVSANVPIILFTVYSCT